MEKKDHIDAFGAASLVAFSLLLAFNQVVVKVVNEGLQPVFFAGLRSLGAVVCLWLWFAIRKRPLGLELRDLRPGLLIGSLFAAEFILIFIAIDLTTVSRASILFYTMPLWMALMGHVLLPGERITPVKALGLALAFGGAVVAILWREGAGEASLLGDLLALGAAFCWAGIAIVARAGLPHVAPDRQLIWQVLVSAPILLVLAPLFGPLIRDLQMIHLAGLAFQTIIVVSAGFAFWLWLLTIYPAASVAAFSFLAPVFAVTLGWGLLGEPIGLPILLALVLVSTGLILINRQVPQKV